MAPRIAWPAARRCSSSIGPIINRRTFVKFFNSARSSSPPMRLTWFHEQAPNLEYFTLQVGDIAEAKEKLVNPDRHNAAVLLTTPESHMLQGLKQPERLADLVKQLADGADIDEFHLLCAGVDHVAPPLGSSVVSPGISILRCHINDLKPEFGEAPVPQSKEDADKVGAIAFEMDKACVTVPLARTTFQNGSTSTLISYRFPMVDGSPQWRDATAVELKSTRIRLPRDTASLPIPKLSMSIPLFPITRPRLITESFGNIIRSVEVDGESVPASQELEAAINGIPASTIAGPVGVWAAVTSDFCPSNEVMEVTKAPKRIPLEDETTQAMVNVTDGYLQQIYQHGVSGGGGWGPKRGLLSLDPEQTHFTLPEEEDLDRFAQMMDGSGFAPAGSSIQYFFSTPAPRVESAPYHSAYTFGVPGTYRSGDAMKFPAYKAWNTFGALSKSGLFLSGPISSHGGHVTTSKLTVPHARVSAVNADTIETLAGNDIVV